MATYTSNYNWTKPALNDPVDITVLNGNLDSQDDIIHEGFSALANADNNIYEVMGQMGAKNLLIYPYSEEDTKTYRGVTYTVNTDNTISLSGTADGGTSSYVLHPSSQNIKYPAGTYILSGCPTGGARNTYWMQLAHGGTVDTYDLGEGASVTLESEQVVGIGFYVAAGVDVTGKIIKPMLRLATDTDDTYQPYAKTNKQLTDDINAITPHILPDVPTSDGDYSLKLSIADGVPTYSWSNA